MFHTFMPLFLKGRACHAVGEAIQLVIGKRMFVSSNSMALAILANHLFEPIGHRLLDFFLREQFENAVRMDPLISYGLLLGQRDDSNGAEIIHLSLLYYATLC